MTQAIMYGIVGGMAQNSIQSIGGGSFSEDGTVALGQIVVNARISVLFELE